MSMSYKSNQKIPLLFSMQAEKDYEDFKKLLHISKEEEDLLNNQSPEDIEEFNNFISEDLRDLGKDFQQYLLIGLLLREEELKQANLSQANQINTPNCDQYSSPIKSTSQYKVTNENKLEKAKLSSIPEVNEDKSSINMSTTQKLVKNNIKSNQKDNSKENNLNENILDSNLSEKEDSMNNFHVKSMSSHYTENKHSKKSKSKSCLSNDILSFHPCFTKNMVNNLSMNHSNSKISLLSVDDDDCLELNSINEPKQSKEKRLFYSTKLKESNERLISVVIELFKDYEKNIETIESLIPDDLIKKSFNKLITTPIMKAKDFSKSAKAELFASSPDFSIVLVKGCSTYLSVTKEKNKLRISRDAY